MNYQPVKTDYHSGLATLDDWQGLQDLLFQYERDTKAHAGLHLTKEILQTQLVNSLSMPHQVGMLVLRRSEYDTVDVVAVAMLFAIAQPNINMPGIALTNSSFINSVYSCDRYIPKKTREEFLELIFTWSMMRRCNYVFGNISPDRNWRATCRRYGFKPMHVVIGKKLEGIL